jgi:hypothetical protein
MFNGGNNRGEIYPFLAYRAQRRIAFGAHRHDPPAKERKAHASRIVDPNPHLGFGPDVVIANIHPTLRFLAWLPGLARSGDGVPARPEPPTSDTGNVRPLGAPVHLLVRSGSVLGKSLVLYREAPHFTMDPTSASRNRPGCHTADSKLPRRRRPELPQIVSPTISSDEKREALRTQRTFDSNCWPPL